MNQLLIAAIGGIASGAISAVIAAFTFTLRFTARLAALEAHVGEQEKRLDRLEKQIFEALYRIEQKIDTRTSRS